MTTMTTMTEPAPPIGPGAVLSQRYRLGEELGRGGAGRVFRAHDERLDRPVAVKVLFDLGPTATTRFSREAATAARIRHPNVVTLHDAGVDGAPYLVMTLVDGPSLDEAVRTSGPLSPAAADRLAAQLFAALEATHDAGVLHRDLTPRNILLDNDGTALVADFGIARGIDDPTVTAAHTVMGTRPYVAPERLHGAEATPASDVFAVGVTLRHAVTGSPDGPMPDGHPLTSLVARCTATDPAERPDVSEFVGSVPPSTATVPIVTGDDLPVTEAIAPPTTVIPTSLPAGAPTGVRVGRRPVVAAGVLLLAAVVLSIGAMSSDDAPVTPAEADPGTERVEAEPVSDRTGPSTEPAPAFDPAAPDASVRQLAEWLRAQDD